MIRTGVYGGSFNPIHQGHVALARHLVAQGLVDEVWLVVSPCNPFKVDSRLLDEQARLSLARLAVEHEPDIDVSDIELFLPRPSYMSVTLRTLSARYAERQFSLIIGADNWERFHQWHEADWIREHYPLIVIPRPGHPLGELPSGVQCADTPLMDISSTWIRTRIPQPDYQGEGLCPQVWEEIRSKGYYRRS
ncbi:MAG: nicotinate (nicotinamide) nucleotide adenylyltransferase [Paraprevotella sp.]|nr:nicotinate (nicotinamide) nucleotide adenylyltransferase [Paraprevotella sp.]MDY4615906.1 nicotinate (nicotinamide) nucleotide adenylyltransferase [Bacteroidaceae bacterium]MDD5971033.1 nicotinate (nicotinamide) nucleotide adenylyltransferase [Paraprevotella sp.]MDD6124677.1 nicotinate (nicotinamide) nucleotide adenylyltransferase [Paraprevotella sp.]MDD6608082.1 nicotinate (nicotinamide) nucleotide adenylyltransferase [Paraprevotella sp.]